MAERKVPLSEEQAHKIMQEQHQKEANNEQRETILRAVLDPAARERLKRISTVKPERAEQVENHIIMGVRSGKMQPPISDEVVRELLGQLSESGGGRSNNITFARKKMDDDW